MQCIVCARGNLVNILKANINIKIYVKISKLHSLLFVYILSENGYIDVIGTQTLLEFKTRLRKHLYNI